MSANKYIVFILDSIHNHSIPKAIRRLKLVLCQASFEGFDGGVGAVPPPQGWNPCTPQ
jgi:hypothetical protein